jgi:hypothetical protein
MPAAHSVSGPPYSVGHNHYAAGPPCSYSSPADRSPSRSLWHRHAAWRSHHSDPSYHTSNEPHYHATKYWDQYTDRDRAQHSPRQCSGQSRAQAGTGPCDRHRSRQCRRTCRCMISLIARRLSTAEAWPTIALWPVSFPGAAMARLLIASRACCITRYRRWAGQ